MRLLRKFFIHATSSHLKILSEKWGWNCEYNVKPLIYKIILQYNFVRDSNFCILLAQSFLYSRIGCHIAGECVNHIAYAEDMVLLAPSIKALQTLINLCFKFAGENDILYNETKTQCIALGSVRYGLLEVCCWSGSSWS